jgi:peptide/nickel transport system substrate-binding protein
MTPELRRPRSIPARALAALILIAAVGCGRSDGPGPPAATDGPRRGGTAVLGSISDVDAWNEYLSQQSFAVNLLRRIFLRLAREPGPGQGGPGDYAPLLAESWESSADGLSLTFRLREAVWSDGEPITASDVRFTWLAQTSPDVPWVGADSKRHITDVRAVDDRTVTFRFDTRYPYQLSDAVEGGILPEHVFGKIPFDQWTTHDWSAHSIGSGPFLLQSHRPAVETVLVRNPRYFEAGLPYLDRVVVRYVPDISNLLTQLLAGDIDYLEGVSPRDAARLSSNAELTLLAFDAPGYDYIGWNELRSPFDVPEVRRALTLAIDREALVQDLLFGFGRVSIGPVPSSWWGAVRDREAWPYDPDESRRILVRHGYGAAGGKTLQLELLTNSGNRTREEMLVKIQEQLSRVGVDVRARPLEMRTMREKITSEDYDAYLGGWVFSGRVELQTFFASEAVPPHGYNVVHYRSVDVDRLLEQLDKAEDASSTRPLLEEIQHRIHDDLPYTFLYETKRIAAHGPRLAGVEIDIPSDSLARLERFWIR